jgi:hypothetical protein
MSPPTGISIDTSWLNSPVCNTFLNCPKALTSDVSLGKYTISCLGGEEDILGSSPCNTGVVESNLKVWDAGLIGMREAWVKSLEVSWRVMDMFCIISSTALESLRVLYVRRWPTGAFVVLLCLSDDLMMRRGELELERI